MSSRYNQISSWNKNTWTSLGVSKIMLHIHTSTIIVLIDNFLSILYKIHSHYKKKVPLRLQLLIQKQK